MNEEKKILMFTDSYNANYILAVYINYYRRDVAKYRLLLIQI